MSTDAILLIILLVLALVGFVTNVLRYDVVALLTLLGATVLGVVPAEQAFTGFGHPAVVTVAAVLVISRAFFQSGLVDVLSGLVVRVGRHPTLQVLTLTGTVALLSAFMNNVGALALMLPVGLKIARTHALAPSCLLMPLSFGSLLGGLTTLIGTPPNVIVANYWGTVSGRPFGLFDFTPVGLGVAVAGVLFIGLVGWHLLPVRKGQASPEDRFEVASYLGELRVEKESAAVGLTLRQLPGEIKGAPPVIALVRGKTHHAAHRFRGVLQPGDILLAEGETEEIETLATKAGLTIDFRSKDKAEEAEANEQPVPKAADLSLVEAVVMADSRLAGRTVADLRLHDQYDLNLIAVARQGRRLKGRLRDVRFQSGDVLLLQGSADAMAEQLAELRCLPLADRGLRLGKPRKLVLSILLFGGAIAMILGGWLTAPVALMVAAVLMVVTGVVDLRGAYGGIDWPVLVLLAAMIPVGAALETTGGAAALASGILAFGSAWPPVVTLGVLLLVTMCLSDVINNAAAAVLMCPIAVNLALGLEVAPQPFLMAVAIGASCAFLTPIGHQSNTLVFGPGGYHFGDYWKLGLPLQVVMFVVAIPLLLWAWPMQ
jgi:di/tricarboxylate transporter